MPKKDKLKAKTAAEVKGSKPIVAKAKKPKSRSPQSVSKRMENRKKETRVLRRRYL